MENYLNLFEHIPEDEHSRISNMIWEALDRAGIELSQDAELSIRIYDDEYEGASFLSVSERETLVCIKKTAMRHKRGE